MKAVLISIHPNWVQKILDGEKTVEVRKTAPKLKPPFKCYIYCTKGDLSYKVGNGMICHNNGGMVVVGEFICDEIYPIKVFNNGTIQNWNFYDLANSCVPYDDIVRYIGNNRSGYGLHISGLKVYDKPKKLGDFTPHCKFMTGDMLSCDHRKVACNCQHFDLNPWPDCSLNAVICKRRMKRPPQSWCYVEEINHG